MPDIFNASSRKSKAKKQEKPFLKEKQALKAKPGLGGKGKTVADELKKERTTTPFASLAIRPAKIKFDTQEKGEKIILLLRRHPITNFGWVFFTLVLALAPVFILKTLPSDFIPQRFISIAILAWYVLTISFAFEKFLLWFFTVNIVTDERIVDIDYPTLLYRRISDTKIDKIQDKTVAMGGFFQSLFNYGDVLIQTAGEVPEFEFSKVSQPEKVVKILNMLLLEEEQEALEGRAR